MVGTIDYTTVEGHTYKYWADFVKRCTIAEDEKGNQKAIRNGGYLKNDLSVRKAIAQSYGCKTFRKV